MVIRVKTQKKKRTMNKKAYITPAMTVVRMTTTPMMQTFSGQGTDGVKTKSEEDNSDEPNRSRRRNVWDDEEEDF